jgi:NADPH-dependent F420 reductase
VGKYTIAVIGGTGAEGRGLALRFAKAGHRVVIGSRDGGRAKAAAAELGTRLGPTELDGAENTKAAAAAEIVILAVPFTAQMATAKALARSLVGKILVDCTAPLIPPAVSRVQLPAGGSSVEAVQRELGDQVRVVAAFQNVSSHLLEDLDRTIDCDVLVCSNDKEARATVAGLVGEIGLRAVQGGVLANSAAAEALTSVLIAVNRFYKVKTAGIRFTGLPAEIE